MTGNRNSEPIRGSVAQILNHRELVINRGSGHGVKSGMKFAVLNRRGAEIVDPDSGEALGSVDVAKVLVEAVRVSERLSVCRTYRERQTTSFFDVFGAKPGTTPKIETLRAADHTYQEELSEEESVVKIGDPFVQLEKGDEYVATSATS